MAGVVGPFPGLEKKLCEGTTLSPNWQKNTEWPFGMSPEFTVSVTCVPPLDGPSLGSIEKLYLAMPPRRAREGGKRREEGAGGRE